MTMLLLDHHMFPLLSSHLLSSHRVCQGKTTRHLFFVTVLRYFFNAFKSCIDNFQTNVSQSFFLPAFLLFLLLSTSAPLPSVCQWSLCLYKVYPLSLYTFILLAILSFSISSPFFIVSVCHIFCYQTALQNALVVLLISETAHQRYAHVLWKPSGINFIYLPFIGNRAVNSMKSALFSDVSCSIKTQGSEVRFSLAGAHSYHHKVHWSNEK